MKAKFYIVTFKRKNGETFVREILAWCKSHAEQVVDKKIQDDESYSDVMSYKIKLEKSCSR